MKVFVKLPNAGLGNKMIVWALAQILAKEYNTSIIGTGWVTFQKTAILSNWKTRRIYNGYFKKVSGWYSLVGYHLLRAINHPKSIYRKSYPSFFNESNKQGTNSIEITQLPNHLELFTYFQKDRDWLIQQLYNTINPNIHDLVDNFASPQIGIHLRLGDFVEVNTMEEFFNTAAARTPQSYFINVIRNIQVVQGNKKQKISIFSDGNENDLSTILNAFPEAKLVYTGNDLADILLLSRSKILITSADSSFGLWAAYLNNGIVIHNPKNLIRVSSQTSHLLFENTISQDVKDWPVELIDALKNA